MQPDRAEDTSPTPLRDAPTPESIELELRERLVEIENGFDELDLRLGRELRELSDSIKGAKAAAFAALLLTAVCFLIIKRMKVAA